MKGSPGCTENNCFQKKKKWWVELVGRYPSVSQFICKEDILIRLKALQSGEGHSLSWL